MPVLEILQLRVKEGVSTSDPAIFNSLAEVRATLKSKVVNTQSRFYQCVEDTTLIYLFGVWPSLETHHAFLESPEKDEILHSQDEVLDFIWMLHIPISSISDLPLEAPVLVLCITGLDLAREEHPMTMDLRIEIHRSNTEEATKPYKVVNEVRYDREHGRRELITITGWESLEAYEAFVRGASLPDCKVLVPLQ